MSEARIRGEETQIRMVQDGQLLAELTAIKDWDFEWRIENKREGYVGETADRHDEYFKEVGGNITLHIEGQQLLALAEFVRSRAQRRTSTDRRVAITFRMTFPNGKRPRVTVQDAKFETIPLKSPGRDQYVTVNLPWAADGAIVALQ